MNIVESQKKIAESLKGKIEHLKEKYSQLASGINHSPLKRADMKENYPVKNEVVKKKETMKVKRHNSQEDIVMPQKSNEKVRGILRQSSRPNIQVQPATVKADIHQKDGLFLKIVS